MLHPPEFERDQLPVEVSSKIARSFEEGRADEFAARSLVRAGVVSYHPLHGGIFWRREPVKYIIVHSTETGIPMGAARVIDSWGSSGRRHAGAQYVVDRDGTIFQSVDPDLATVHVNVFKTLPGINNDNSIGIEMCHTGHQTYPQEQRQSVIHLVSYLQDRYKVPDANVVTHRYAQRGDHTDPVNFDWEQFLADKDRFHYQALAYKVDRIQQESANLHVPSVQTAGTFSSPANVTNYAVQMANPRVPVTPTPTVIRQVPRATVQSGGAELRGPIEVEPGFVGKLNQGADDSAASVDPQPAIPSAVPLPQPINNIQILPKIQPGSYLPPDINPSKSSNKDSDVQMFLQPGHYSNFKNSAKPNEHCPNR